VTDDLNILIRQSLTVVPASADSLMFCKTAQETI